VAGLMRGPDNELSSPELRRILLEDGNGCPCLGGGIGRVWRVHARVARRRQVEAPQAGLERLGHLSARALRGADKGR
jgi:hypothetical protein